MKGFGPESFGDFNAEGYDDWYGNPSVELTEKTVNVLVELAEGGAILELAVGTGRVAIPLANKGLYVSGIEASSKMIAKLKEKPGSSELVVIQGNMAEFNIDASYKLIFLVFNTLFNLNSQKEQARCFNTVSKHLDKGGKFLIETYVPEPEHYEKGENLKTVHISLDRTVIEACMHDVNKQTVDYQYIEITEQGIRMHPLPIRYSWPSEIDLMAENAGLKLFQRWADWQKTPFTSSSKSHISVYIKK